MSRLPALCPPSEVRSPFDCRSAQSKPNDLIMRPQTTEPAAHRTYSDTPTINCSDRAHAAVVSLVERIGHPHRGLSARLAVVLRDLCNLAELPERERPTEAE